MRTLTQFPATLTAWFNLGHIKSLLKTCENTNFTVQSDAIQTSTTLLVTERPLNSDWIKFIEGNAKGLFDLFSDIYNEMLGDDDEDEEEAEGEEQEEPNYVALRELMKLEYQFLTMESSSLRQVQLDWSNDKERLKQVMQMFCSTDMHVK